jgi:hypothetical protein
MHPFCCKLHDRMSFDVFGFTGVLRKKIYQINILDIKYSDNEQNKATITYIKKNRKSSLEYTITQSMVKTPDGWKILYP